MVKIRNKGTGTYHGHDVERGVVIEVSGGAIVDVSESMAQYMTTKLGDTHDFEIVKPVKAAKPKTPDTKE